MNVMSTRITIIKYYRNKETLRLLEAQEVADATGEPVYWNLRQAPASMRDTLNDDAYKMIVPNNGQAYTDEVKALDNIIWKWITLIYTNEKEKVMARTSGQSVGTFSVN